MILSDLWDWLKSVKTDREINPDNIPDPCADTVKEMKTKDEEGTHTINILKIKF